MELYTFNPCYPSFSGLNCKFRCHCDPSCLCDPVVGCSQCHSGRGCDLLYEKFPECQGKNSCNETFKTEVSPTGHCLRPQIKALVDVRKFIAQ